MNKSHAGSVDIMTDFDKNIKQESGEFYDPGVQVIH